MVLLLCMVCLVLGIVACCCGFCASRLPRLDCVGRLTQLVRVGINALELALRPLTVVCCCQLLAYPPTCRGWLEFIEEVRQQVGQVVLLTCPTDRFRTAPKEAGRAVVAQRNEIVRRLVADSWSRGGGTSGGAGSSGRGGSMHAEGAAGAAGGGGSSGSSTAVGGGTAHRPRPLLLLDLDALTKEGLPPGLQISADDYHYQCYPSTSSGFASELQPWARARRRGVVAADWLHHDCLPRHPGVEDASL